MQPVELPPMQAHHVDPFTGEDELAMADAALAAATPAWSASAPERRAPLQKRRAAAGPRSQGSRNVGQGLPQRRLPLRLRQEIQALPRQARLSATLSSRALCPGPNHQQTRSLPIAGSR